MVTASFSIHNLEFFLLILTRVSTMIYAAPFFNIKGVPGKLKIGLAFFLSIIVASAHPYYDLQYNTVLGYAIMVMFEAIIGLALGLAANIAMVILAFAGHLIDVDIGFSMVQLFDPLTNQSSSAFGSFYSYLVMLVMILSNMHYYIITAVTNSFDIIPLGTIGYNEEYLYESIVYFAVQYFIIGFEIILPVFASTLLLNIVLGVLAKTAPQMNMFVVGMQLKIIVGLGVLLVIVICIPNITETIYATMQDMVERMMKVMTP